MPVILQKRSLFWLLILIFLSPCILLPRILFAEVQQGIHVEAELISPRAAIVPGEKFELGLRLKMDPEWHVYWKYAGDSGNAPKLKWNVAEHIAVKELVWPYPKRLQTGPLVNFGYENEVILTQEFFAESALSDQQPARILLDAEILACKEECIPSNFSLQISLPVIQGMVPAPTDWAKAMNTSRQKSPSTEVLLEPEAKTSDSKIFLTLDYPNSGEQQPPVIEIFPDIPGRPFDYFSARGD